MVGASPLTCSGNFLHAHLGIGRASFRSRSAPPTISLARQTEASIIVRANGAAAPAAPCKVASRLRSDRHAGAVEAGEGEAVEGFAEGGALVAQ
jgi:hypothetical protein